MAHTLTVRGCSDCPLKHESGYGEWCAHPLTTAEMDNSAGISGQTDWWRPEFGQPGVSPDWCPLRNGALQLFLEPQPIG